MENMHEMVMESSRIADSLEAAIKQKEAVLEDLSDLVDEKLKIYERINNNTTTNINRYAEIKPREEKFVEPKKESAFISSESLINEKINKQPVQSVQSMNIQPAAKVVETDNSKADKKTRIIMLHKSGKSDIDIAKELGISITEVQLALRLLPKV